MSMITRKVFLPFLRAFICALGFTAIGVEACMQEEAIEKIQLGQTDFSQLNGHEYYMQFSYETFVQRMATMKPGVGRVFIGDSITAGLNTESRLSAINLGIAGDRVALVKDRVPNYSNLEDKTVILALGINDLPGDIESIRDDYRTLLCRLPESSTVLISSVLPIDEVVFEGLWEGVKTNSQVEELNTALEKLADEFEHVTFANTRQLLLNDEGSLCGKCHYDGIHLTTEGYERWLKGLGEALSRLDASS